MTCCLSRETQVTHTHTHTHTHIPHHFIIETIKKQVSAPFFFLECKWLKYRKLFVVVSQDKGLYLNMHALYNELLKDIIIWTTIAKKRDCRLAVV